MRVDAKMMSFLTGLKMSLRYESKAPNRVKWLAG